jgi:hypothetical protein
VSANVEEYKPGATGEVRTGVVLKNRLNPELVQYYAIDGLAIFEGDIVLGTVEQMDQLLHVIPAIVTEDQYRWPDAVVPFQIDPSVPQGARNAIDQAIEHWQDNTIIRFRERNADDADFVTFISLAQKSKATPALAAFNGLLHMVHLGDTSNDIWHSTFDGAGWTLNVKIPDQKSKAAPALAVFDGRLHMVHLGDESNDIWWSQFDGNSWSANEQIPRQKSKAAPALAAFNGRLHLVHLGDESNDLWWSHSDGSAWQANVRIPGQKSKATPALSALNDRLHMVHLGDTSNDIWHSTFDGTSWRPNVRIPNQKSKAAPALAVFGSRLYLVHLGDESNAIWYSWYIP